MSLKEYRVIEVTCKCCGHVYKAHELSNSLQYSQIPNYGCSICEGNAERAKVLAEKDAAISEMCEVLEKVASVIRGEDIAGVWLNYPDKPEVTLGSLVDNAIAKYKQK